MPTRIALLWLQWQIAEDILSKMNRTADPCIDFHHFACGNYGRGLHLLNDTAVYWPMSEITLKNAQHIRSKACALPGHLGWPSRSHDSSELLEEPPTVNETESTRLAKTYYKSCMNESAMEHLGLAPLKKLIGRYGGWPVLEGADWNESDHDWIALNAHLTRDLDGASIVQFSVGADYKNSTRQMLHVCEVASITPSSKQI